MVFLVQPMESIQGSGLGQAYLYGILRIDHLPVVTDCVRAGIPIRRRCRRIACRGVTGFALFSDGILRQAYIKGEASASDVQVLDKFAQNRDFQPTSRPLLATRQCSAS